MEEVAAIVKIVFDRACPRGLSLPKVYSLETMLHFFERAMKKAQKFDPTFRGKAREAIFESPLNTKLVMQSEALDHQILPCSFHEQMDNFNNCTLGIVRRRAFTILDQFCDVSCQLAQSINSVLIM